LGNPIGYTIEYGDDCTWCVPGTWLAGQTPKFLKATISGAVRCPGTPPYVPDINGEWILEQVDPCTWSVVSGATNCIFIAQDPLSYFVAFVAGGLSFSGYGDDTCDLSIDNDATCAGWAWYEGGSVTLEPYGTGDPDADFVAAALGIEAADDTRWEGWPMEPPDPNVSGYNYYNPYIGLKMLVKFDLTHYDQYETFEE
jgi:hypothetical protein